MDNEYSVFDILFANTSRKDRVLFLVGWLLAMQYVNDTYAKEIHSGR